ncbi:MAG: aminotransferase class V-fold PLP-dependent enzyme, partial [Kordiimonadaceae bacterium]|nr:aminotransferase class V-fold PLP-dependent enzyme [Kordiimonadaceae bacterium]
AGAIPIDGPGSEADVIISGSYKWLCGPFGAAVMYLAPHLQAKLDPGIIGFRSHENMWELSPERLVYPNSAKRFESSTMAFGCIKGLEKSIEYLLGVGIENIYDHNLKLSDILINGLSDLGANIISPMEQSERTSIVTCFIDGLDTKIVIEKLKEQDVVAHKRQKYIRFAPHLYNCEDDVLRALEALENIIKK